MPGKYERKPWAHLYSRAAWKALRQHQLSSAPLCAMCTQSGKTTAATVADHVIPHKGDEALFFDARNLQSLCKVHHDSSKARQEARGYVMGCDVNGMPIDPHHHWHG